MCNVYNRTDSSNMHSVVPNNIIFLECVFPSDSDFPQTDGKYKLNSPILGSFASYSLMCLHHHTILRCFQVDHLFEDDVDPLNNSIAKYSSSELAAKAAQATLARP